MLSYIMCFPWWTKNKLYKNMGDECAICLGVIRGKGSECTECQMRMHKKCLIRWKYSCKKREVDYTCPLCRYVIKEYIQDVVL